MFSLCVAFTWHTHTHMRPNSFLFFDSFTKHILGLNITRANVHKLKTGDVVKVRNYLKGTYNAHGSYLYYDTFIEDQSGT